jgi:hypothetical protein
MRSIQTITKNRSDMTSRQYIAPQRLPSLMVLFQRFHRAYRPMSSL